MPIEINPKTKNAALRTDQCSHSRPNKRQPETNKTIINTLAHYLTKRRCVIDAKLAKNQNKKVSLYFHEIELFNSQR